MEDVDDLRVLTFNTWGLLYIAKDIEARMKVISDELAKGHYHLVHLQEVWSSKYFEMIREKVKHVLPYSHYFHSGFLGSGCATFSKYPIVDTIFYKFSQNGHFWDVLHGDWFGGKGVGCAIIKHPKRKVFSFNTHLHADYHTKCSNGLDECRTLQSYQLAQFVRQVTRPSDAIILSGDMNHTPESLGIKTILELAKLNDTYEITSKRPLECNTVDVEFNKYASGSDVTSRIDYIFSSDDFECISCDLAMQKIAGTDMHFSDHEGYTATLQFKESDGITKPSEYIDSSSSQSILQQLHNVIKNGEQIADEIHWKKVLSVFIIFLMLVVLPVLSTDTFHVVFPPISTWYGKGVFILQVFSIMFCVVYLWVLTYIRTTDAKAFRGICSEIKIRLHALEMMNERVVK